MDPPKNLEILDKAGQNLSWNRKKSKNSPSVVPPLFGDQYLKNVSTMEKVGKEGTCQQVLRARHLLTTSNPDVQAIGSWARYLGLGTLA